MMKNTNSRETVIKEMRKVVADVSPEVVIRRLQNDNAFVIYSSVNITNTFGNSQKGNILIDIITEKTKPEFFKTIKNMIKVIDNAEEFKDTKSHSHAPMFYPALVKDIYVLKDDTIIEKLIKFNSIDMALPKGISADDEFNIVQMMYNCADYIKNHKSMLDKFYPVNSSIYKYFRYGFALMNKRTSDDEVLKKVITEDLYGYHIDYKDEYCELRRGDEHISYSYKCKNKLCKRMHDSDCLIDLVLYYTAKTTLYNDRVYLKGEYIYSPLGFIDDNDFNIIERYLIPRTWFDFEGIMNVYDAKIDNIICDNCGSSLLR